jgi:hypothetical protein
VSQTDPLQNSLTIREAAALLSVHPNTVRNRINKGIYKAEKVITSHGPTYFIQRESLANRPTNSSSTKDLQKLPNNLLEASPQDLQAQLSSAVKEAIATTQAEATQKEKLTRAREGALEALKLEHNSAQNLGILSLAAIGAFGAILGAFSDPKAWDDSLTLINDSFLTFTTIPISRPIMITITFGAFLLSAIAARALELRIRYEVRQAAKAEEVTEIETLQNTMRSPRYIGTWERVLLAIAFGVGAIAFLTFIAQSIG